MSEYLFKATGFGGEATHGGDYRYRLNRWTRHEAPINPCRKGGGFHLAEGKQVLGWLAPQLWLAEACPDHELVYHYEGRPKVVTCRTRLVERLDGWDERAQRLFACDCADDALALVTDPDPRSVEAVVVSRRFANGDATRAELDAAWDAASAAELANTQPQRPAWEAAWDAAITAVRTAARDAAITAETAARAAAIAAVGGVGWDAQYQRLLGYLGLGGRVGVEVVAHEVSINEKVDA